MDATEIIEYLKKRNVVARIDESLDEYNDKIFCPEKLEKANDMLRRIGIPKQWIKSC